MLVNGGSGGDPRSWGLGAPTKGVRLVDPSPRPPSTWVHCRQQLECEMWDDVGWLDWLHTPILGQFRLPLGIANVGTNLGPPHTRNTPIHPYFGLALTYLERAIAGWRMVAVHQIVASKTNTTSEAKALSPMANPTLNPHMLRKMTPRALNESYTSSSGIAITKREPCVGPPSPGMP